MISSFTVYVGVRDFPACLIRVGKALSKIPMTPTGVAPRLQRLVLALDSGLGSATTEGLRDIWEGVWPVALSNLTLPLPCSSITLRALYPLGWDQNLLDSIRALKVLGPLHFEYTTADGASFTYVPTETTRGV